MKTYTYYIESKKRCAVTIEAPSEEEANRCQNGIVAMLST